MPCAERHIPLLQRQRFCGRLADLSVRSKMGWPCEKLCGASGAAKTITLSFLKADAVTGGPAIPESPLFGFFHLIPTHATLTMLAPSGQMWSPPYVRLSRGETSIRIPTKPYGRTQSQA